MNVIYVNFKDTKNCGYKYEDETSFDPIDFEPFVRPTDDTLDFSNVGRRKEYYDLTQDIDLEIKSLERAMKYIEYRIERLLCRSTDTL